MAVIESFRTAFTNYYDLWESKLGVNQKQANIKEETLRKLHGLSDQFFYAGLDGDYDEALTHYQTMLTLLNVDASDVAWDVTTADLITLFGVGNSSVVGAFQTIAFANPIVIDATTYKNWKCYITDVTVIDLTNTVNGDSGQIIATIGTTGIHSVTLGTMFTLQVGSNTIDSTANTTNVITWSNTGTDIIYTIDTANTPA